MIRATAVGKDTALHRMADLVAIAESGRSRYTSLADSAAKLYAPGVHILSALAFAGWYLATGDLRVAINIAAANPCPETSPRTILSLPSSRRTKS